MVRIYLVTVFLTQTSSLLLRDTKEQHLAAVKSFAEHHESSGKAGTTTTVTTTVNKLTVVTTPKATDTVVEKKVDTHKPRDPAEHNTLQKVADFIDVQEAAKEKTQAELNQRLSELTAERMNHSHTRSQLDKLHGQARNAAAKATASDPHANCTANADGTKECTDPHTGVAVTVPNSSPTTVNGCGVNKSGEVECKGSNIHGTSTATPSPINEAR